MADPTLVERKRAAIERTQRGLLTEDGRDYITDAVVQAEDVIALVAEVRRLEAMQTIRAEILLNVQAAGFEAGARAMREAAAKRVASFRGTSPDEFEKESPCNCATCLRCVQLAQEVRALPVPPAPSPAHDGKEGG